MIRNLFFALVLLNLAFAAWSAWYAETPRPSAPRESGVPIRLVGEAAAVPGENPASSREPPEPPVSSGRAPERELATGQRQESQASSDEPADPDASSSELARASDSDGEPGAAPASSSAARAPEPSAAGSPGAADGLASADAAESGARCVSIGPFESVGAAATASAALEAGGFMPSQRSAQGEIWVGFWVRLDAIGSREEANRMLAQARANGVPDAYLIPGDQEGDMISLAVYNTLSRAGVLDEQLRRIGLEPTIVERSRPGTVYWLDISVDDDGQVDLGALGIREPRVGQQSCADV